MTNNLVCEDSLEDSISLYPNELSNGYPITQDEKFKLSEQYSRLFFVYVERLALILSKEYDIKLVPAKVLARRVLPGLIQCFLDRFHRVNKAVKHKDNQLTIPRVNKDYQFEIMEEFEILVGTDPEFNQWLIGRVGQVWDVPESKPIKYKHIKLEQFGFKNNLFTLYSRFNLIRLTRKVFARVSRFFPREKIPSLSFQNASLAFSYFGFYSHTLDLIRSPLGLKKRSADRVRRNVIFDESFFQCDVLDEILYESNVSELESDRVKLILKQFVIDLYPSSLLEDLMDNIQTARSLLEKYKKKILFFSAGLTSADTFIHAAATQDYFMVVNIQHGGHYGYIKCFDHVTESEYYNIDCFVSWGWDKKLNVIDKDISTVGLPSPWLSERKKYWKKFKNVGVKEYDILYMSNYIKRFPAALYGPSQSTTDTIHEYSRELKLLVKTLIKNDISIQHKPYNILSMKLIENTYKELYEIGGHLYHLIQQLDKGLTHKLINKNHIVLWDQPGTGFLECLSSNIPTMICWPRIYSEEDESTKLIFKQLEEQGIVHRKPDTLIAQIKQFKKSPSDWVNNIERKNSIERFCHQFARTSDDWAKQWKYYFQSLESRVSQDG